MKTRVFLNCCSYCITEQLNILREASYPSSSTYMNSQKASVTVIDGERVYAIPSTPIAWPILVSRLIASSGFENLTNVLGSVSQNKNKLVV